VADELGITAVRARTEPDIHPDPSGVAVGLVLIAAAVTVGAVCLGMPIGCVLGWWMT
jgi:hypothetical protein